MNGPELCLQFTNRTYHARRFGRIESSGGLDYLDWQTGSGESVEIADIVVGTDRRKGAGRRLVQALIDLFPHGHDKGVPGITLIYAICKKSNRTACQFYEALGFRIIARLHNFHQFQAGKWEDALMYGLDL